MAAGLMGGRQAPESRKQRAGPAAPQLVCAVILCLLPRTLCCAEELPDPTRPPPEISAPQAQAAASKESGLQSVIISPARRAAIINGQTVELGAKLGDAKLLEVSESGVVLQGPQGRRTLALFPEVELKKKNQAPEHKNKNAKHAAPDSPPARKADETAVSKERK